MNTTTHGCVSEVLFKKLILNLEPEAARGTSGCVLWEVSKHKMSRRFLTPACVGGVKHDWL